MSGNYLTGFDTASARNRRITTGDCPSSCVEFTGAAPGHFEKARAAESLHNKRLCAQFLGNVLFEPESESEPSGVCSWQDLCTQTTAWLDQHIDQSPLKTYTELGFSSEAEAKAYIKRAGNGGIATIAAFLEIIPRVLHLREFEKPAQDIEGFARRSKGFIIEWAGLCNDVDYILAYALAKKKPHDLAKVFYNLQFATKWFAVTPNGRIILDPEKRDNLRGPTHTKHPACYQPPSVALLGCPARRMIPELYDMMANEAQSAGLFESTYYQERAIAGLVEPSAPCTARIFS